jgi:hypothetical protein
MARSLWRLNCRVAKIAPVCGVKKTSLKLSLPRGFGQATSYLPRTEKYQSNINSYPWQIRDKIVFFATKFAPKNGN